MKWCCINLIDQDGKFHFMASGSRNIPSMMKSGLLIDPNFSDSGLHWVSFLSYTKTKTVIMMTTKLPGYWRHNLSKKFGQPICVMLFPAKFRSIRYKSPSSPCKEETRRDQKLLFILDLLFSKFISRGYNPYCNHWAKSL